MVRVEQKPRVPQRRSGREALGRFGDEQLGDEVLRVVRDARPLERGRERVLGAPRLGAVARERRLAHEQDEEDAPARPEVDGLAVQLALDHLGRHEARRADDRILDERPRAREPRGAAKVADGHVLVVVAALEQQVLGLEVAVDDEVLVAEAHRVEHARGARARAPRCSASGAAAGRRVRRLRRGPSRAGTRARRALRPRSRRIRACARPRRTARLRARGT